MFQNAQRFYTAIRCVQIKMRVAAIAILFIMIPLTMFCQDIKLQISVDKKCTDKDYADFYIVKDSNMVIDYTIVTDSETYELSDTGTYYFYQYFDKNPYHKVHIPEPGFYNVKFNPKTVSLSVWISNPPFSEYLCCEKPCDGIIEELYPNGQTRIKGTFDKGQPIDTITEYYLNGNLRHQYYFPKSSKIKSVTEKYYSSGVIESRFDRYRWGFMESKYDINGEPISELTYKKNTSTTIYYKSGEPIKKVVDGKIKRTYEYRDKDWIQL